MQPTVRQPESGTTLAPSAFVAWLHDLEPSPHALLVEVTVAKKGVLIMKVERFAGHREARQALVLSVAGVTAIMLIANLILMILH
jgi:hypothetical protein